jgi:ABC-type bacteriocin/lantibiotic exporter with double-glycine peptidase domain
LIDGVNIEDVSSTYIRENITSVNQNSKLFDRKVIENMLYACHDEEHCDSNLRRVLQYKKIRELYRNIDIENKESGSLGENLSGGQRQIVNLICGLINPSPVLILDEPTNALDPELKREVIEIIKAFKKDKKAIIIITHDKDMFHLFDEKVVI